MREPTVTCRAHRPTQRDFMKVAIEMVREGRDLGGKGLRRGRVCICVVHVENAQQQHTRQQAHRQKKKQSNEYEHTRIAKLGFGKIGSSLVGQPQSQTSWRVRIFPWACSDCGRIGVHDPRICCCVSIQRASMFPYRWIQCPRGSRSIVAPLRFAVVVLNRVRTPTPTTDIIQNNNAAAVAWHHTQRAR